MKTIYLFISLLSISVFACASHTDFNESDTSDRLSKEGCLPLGEDKGSITREDIDRFVEAYFTCRKVDYGIFISLVNEHFLIVGSNIECNS